MENTITKSIIMAVDFKKRRIRVYKSVLHALGNPKYIQFLISPERREMAVHAVDSPSPNNQAEKIPPYSSNTDVEFYSMGLLYKLNVLIGNIDNNYTYRFTGKAIIPHKIAVFSLDTITKVEN